MVDLYIAWSGWIEKATGLGSSMLHVHCGLIVFILARLVTRRPIDTMIPLTIVIVAEMLNEVFDRFHHGAWRWRDTAGDIFLTLMWPTLLSHGAWARTLWPWLTRPLPSASE